MDESEKVQQMIKKTDKYMKRSALVWNRKEFSKDQTTVEIVRVETWWLFYIIPLYSKETIIDKPR